MALFSIDGDKCKRDGICVDECPVRIIRIGEGVPYPTAGADMLCIDCGHCVTVCPHGAFSHRSMKPEDCPPVRKDSLLTKDQTEHFLRSRRSIRTFKEKPVDKETLTELIRIARYAPSGHNAQPLEWTVLSGRDTIRNCTAHVIDWMKYMIKEHPPVAKALHLSNVVEAWNQGIDTICRDAPHVIIVHADKNNIMGQGAAPVALEYCELAAHPAGLGACWAGYFQSAAAYWLPMPKALGLPENHVCHGALLVGHPKYAYHRLPLRREPVIHWM